MASWESNTVEANGIKLHYTRTGGGKPPVVLAHGVTDSGLCWTPVATMLESDYDVIMVDARGHGGSDAPESGYGPDAQASDLHGLIQALGLQRPVVLGHSMGAATALVLAGTYPDAVGAIVLEDPPAWWLPAKEPTPGDSERVTQMHAWATELKTKTREQLITEKRAEGTTWSEAELQPWADAKLQFSPNVLNIFRTGNAANVDWPTTMRRITCPALLITADPALGAIVTEVSGAALKELIPQLQIAHIPGAGHSIRREQLTPYMDVVRAFLAEHAGA